MTDITRDFGKNIGLHGAYLFLAILTALVIVALLAWTFLPSIQLIISLYAS